jgi:hypothetical protein
VTVSRKLGFRLLVAFSLGWGAWAAWVLLTGAEPLNLSVIDDAGTPVSGAEILTGGRLLAVTSETGTAAIEWSAGVESLTVTAEGHASLQIPVLGRPQSPLEAVLRPRLLRGRIVDPTGKPVEGAYVTASAGTAVTDLEGRFTLRKAEPGEVDVWRPAWDGAIFEWDGSPGEESVTISPETMKAVHVGGEAAQKSWSMFVEMVTATELNALMLDLKDESGAVFYDTGVARARQVRAIDVRYDLAQVVADTTRAGIYLIGRIVAFQDPITAIRAPRLAVLDATTGKAYNVNGQYFLDPTDPAAQAYALELAVEACEAGVDEIQFDYVRFPDDYPETTVFDGGVSESVRVGTIRDFLATAVAQLHPLGCAVAADIFGFITRAIDDGGIGQQWEEVTAVVDVASPMLYPSHYASGWYGFEDPNDHPAELVGYALDDGLERLARQIVVRPWLQDFGYTAEQVRAQIEEADARGLGWMLWNASSNVTVKALAPAE